MQKHDRKSSLNCHVVIIGGHRTSVWLDPAFWAGFKEMARATGRTLTAAITNIAESTDSPNLSSAVRVQVLAFYRAQTETRGQDETAQRKLALP